MKTISSDEKQENQNKSMLNLEALVLFELLTRDDNSTEEIKQIRKSHAKRLVDKILRRKRNK